MAGQTDLSQLTALPETCLTALMFPPWLAECKAVGLDAGFEELDLERSIDD